MIDLLKLHKHFILTHLKEGDVAVDFTMGNGYDTEFLSKTVGESGHVYAFDIQAQAVESTAKHLKEVGCPENYTLIHDSHHNVKNYVKEPIKAGMFNLGWLPGGDKSITTLQFLPYNYLNEAEQMLERMKEVGDESELMLTPRGVRMTVTMVTVIPILCVYPFMQRYLIKGIMIGAVKG